MSEVTITTNEEARAYVEVIIEQAGGPEALLKQEAEYRELSSRMAHESGKLRELYPDKFAAMAPGGVLVIGDDMDEILRGLNEKGVPRGAAVVRFMDVEWGPMVV